jgi:hypothetical protein
LLQLLHVADFPTDSSGPAAVDIAAAVIHDINGVLAVVPPCMLLLGTTVAGVPAFAGVHSV